jgi:hypothetical protein
MQPSTTVLGRADHGRRNTIGLPREGGGRNVTAVPSAAILEQSMGARNRVGVRLSHRPARLHRLAESIPGVLKSLKISSLVSA